HLLPADGEVDLGLVLLVLRRVHGCRREEHGCDEARPCARGDHCAFSSPIFFCAWRCAKSARRFSSKMSPKFFSGTSSKVATSSCERSEMLTGPRCVANTSSSASSGSTETVMLLKLRVPGAPLSSFSPPPRT